jgi:hypothetical protein
MLSRHDQRAQTLCSIKEDRSSTSTAPLVTTLSRKREGDPVRRSRKRRTTKLGNDPAAHLSGIPDCVAEDLDGLSKFYYQPYLTFFLLNAHITVLFCGIKWVCWLTLMQSD